MASTTNPDTDYQHLMGLREGAHFCKMDLHTHSPASECSSFRLPDSLEAYFAGLAKGSEKARVERLRKFVEQRPAQLAKAAGSTSWFVAGFMPPDDGHLRRVARDWLHEIDCGPEDDWKISDYLSFAVRDLRNLVKASYFPEEYIMRAHIEGMQLMALTDHNHPGYVVPRLPELGTWYGKLAQVNEVWTHDIRFNGGQKVRKAMLSRLSLGASRLGQGGERETKGDATTRRQHKEPSKKALDKLAKRLEHVQARQRHWKDESNLLEPLFLLPGTEVTISNVHVLTLYPPEWYVPGRIGAILRRVGISESHWGRGFSAAASASVQDLIDYVAEQGGVAIPAHANSDFKGLLRLFESGLALTKVLEHPNTVALETIGGSVLAGAGKKRGKDACDTLARLEKQGIKPLAFLKGSDAHECRIECDGTGEDIGARFTHVKVDLRHNDTHQEVFKALRLVLSTGWNRVIEDPTEDTYNYYAGGKSQRIKKDARREMLAWRGQRPTLLGLCVDGKGSYGDQLRIRFGPYLNCVVGSGGVATIVTTLAYAFGCAEFLPSSPKRWLPEKVRAYWYDAEGTVNVVERAGRHPDPNDPTVQTRWWSLDAKGKWQEWEASQDQRAEIAALISVWPPHLALQEKSSDYEPQVIDQLAHQLATGTGPLLVNQPRDIFDGERLYTQVLASPATRCRQVIWGTGSPTVPVALDAEKIIVLREEKKGAHVKVDVAGDLHEDEIRTALLNHFEGGKRGFARRRALYEL